MQELKKIVDIEKTIDLILKRLNKLQYPIISKVANVL